MNCTNCIWKLDDKCVNADSIYVKGNVSANILCPFWDSLRENNDTDME